MQRPTSSPRSVRRDLSVHPVLRRSLPLLVSHTRSAPLPQLPSDRPPHCPPVRRVPILQLNSHASAAAPTDPPMQRRLTASKSSRELSEIPTGSPNRTQWVTLTQDRMWKARMALFPHLVSPSLYQMSRLLRLISQSMHLMAQPLALTPPSQPLALTPPSQPLALTPPSLGLMVLPPSLWIRLGMASPSSNFLVGSVHPIFCCSSSSLTPLAQYRLFHNRQYPSNVTRSPNNFCIVYSPLRCNEISCTAHTSSPDRGRPGGLPFESILTLFLQQSP